MAVVRSLHEVRGSKLQLAGTGFVAMENLPDSDESEDELLEEAGDTEVCACA